MKVWNVLRNKLKSVFLKLHVNKTCLNKFGLLLSRILYYYGILLHLVSGYLHLYLHYFIYVLSYIHVFCHSIWSFTYITFRHMLLYLIFMFCLIHIFM